MGTDIWKVRSEPSRIPRDYEFFEWLGDHFNSGDYDGHMTVDLEELRKKLAKEPPKWRRAHKDAINALLEEVANTEFKQETYDLG